jgi:acetoin utilization protein AcuB
MTTPTRTEDAMRINEVMTEDVRTVPPTMSARAAWSLMRAEDIHHLVVKRGSAVVGVLSARDISPQGRQPRIPETVTVEDLMSAPVATVEQGETVRKASRAMKGRTIGCLPVTKNGKLVGIVTMADLLSVIEIGNRAPKGPRPVLSHRVPHTKRHMPTGAW